MRKLSSIKRRSCERISHVGVIAFLSAMATIPVVQAHASDLGIRIGGSADTDVQITAGELFLRHALPWTWQPRDGWRISSHLEAGLGVLDGGGETVATLSVGPVGVLHRNGSRWRFEIGTKPTALSEDRFGAFDIGGHFHFTSHIGIRYQLLPGLSVGYRFQHLSNAGITRPNPGANFHLLALSWTPR